MSSVNLAPGWRMWTIWCVAVAGYVLAIVNRTSLSAVGVDAAQRFDADASMLSLLAVLQLGVYGAMQIPVGLLLDRLGARPILTIGMILMALGQVAIAFAPTLGIAVFARMLVGAGDAAVFPSVLRLIATWFPAQRNPVMVQLTGIIGQMGQVVAIIPLAAFLHATTWSTAFGSVAGLALLFSVLILLVVRNHPPQYSRDVSVDTDTGSIEIVTSAMDTRVGVRAAWSHPGTRLAFWSHFATPFAATAFVVLWGFPFMTEGEGLSLGQAQAVSTTLVLVGIVSGPVLGMLSARWPMYRTYALVVPSVLVQMIAWAAVLLWPGQAPVWLLFVVAVTMGIGGPASMIAFDQARAHNPKHRLSTATGITNVGGFLAALLAVLFIGLALDLMGASRPKDYTPEAFRLAFTTMMPLWLLGLVMVLIERKRTRIWAGIDQPRRLRRASRGQASSSNL